MRRLRALLLGTLCFPLAAAAADTFVVRLPGEAAPLTMEAFSSRFPVASTGIQASPKLTILVYLDGISAASWDRTKTALGTLRTATTRTGGFRLQVINGGEARTINWRTADQFASELRKLTPAAFMDEKPDWFAEAAIIDLFPEAIEDWESLILVYEPKPIADQKIRDYIQALATRRLVTRKLRFSFWPAAPSSPEDAASTWTRVAAATCGEILPAADAPAIWLERLATASCQSLAFDPPQIPGGFIPYTAKLMGATDALMDLPGLLAGPSVEPASIQKYSEMLRTLENARTALNSNLGDVVREALQQVLQTNPMHIEALRFAADLYKRQSDLATTLRLLDPIALVAPADADLFKELGDLQFELKNWSESEHKFKRSLELNPKQPATLERMSVIREQLGDLTGASDYVHQVIETNPGRLDLYLRHARLLDRLERFADASKSLEKALDLNASLDDVRTRLAEIHKAAGNTSRTVELLNARINLPGDVTSRMQYAQLAEKLDLPKEALTFYTLALESDPGREPAYFGRARLLIDADRRKDAYETVLAGLNADSKSLRLRLMQIDLLEKDDRIFDLRNAIRTAAGLFPDDEQVLRHAARSNDVFGDRAGETYERWAAALERTGNPSGEIQQALERALIVALRDGEQQAADRVSEKLQRFASSPFRSGVKPAVTGRSTLVVPGGIHGLAQAVDIDPTVSPLRFVSEYSRAILRSTVFQSAERERFKNRLRLYLKTVQALKAFGRESGGATEISIEVQSNQGVDRAEKILDLLGWRIRRVRNAFELEVGTDAEAAVRQSFGSSLGIDEFAMKSRLEKREPFTFKIADERASMIFDEAYWFGTILKEPRPRRSLLEEMLENLAITRLYIGLASMNDETQRAVVQAVEPDQLLKRSVRLAFYASSIAIENGRIILPGGPPAQAAWNKLVEANSERTGPFLENLLRRDDGKLLSYYHALAVLPQDHQSFFTRTPQRLAAFYKVFPFEDEASLEKNFFLRRDDVFARMARDLPLDQDGTILFPGSERVWSVAKGGSDNITDIEKLAKRVRRASSPDAEDEIVLNMLDRKNEIAGRKVSQIENFLAVARIEAHRKDPMDELMALTLSQMYAKYGAVFPYFAAFPSLAGKDLAAFAKAAERLERLDQAEINTVLGELHSLIKLIALLKENGMLPEPKAAELFTLVSNRFATAKTYAEISTAAFDAVERILAGAGAGNTDGADSFLLRAFSGESAPKEFVLDGSVRSVDLASKTRGRMREVLKLQSITSLDTLLGTYRAAQAMSRNPQASALTEIEANAPKLLEITETAADKLTSKQREELVLGHPAEVMKAVTKLRTEFAKKKPSKEFPKFAAELVEELNPFLKTTLVGWIYAYYFSPQDLAIASDRYLVRRHIFHESFRKEYWPESRMASHDTGSYLSGGFAQIANGVAAIAKTKVEAADSLTTNPTQETVILAELAAVRSMPWRQVQERSMHLVGLKLRLGRELVVRALFDADLRNQLAQATVGLLGPRRRFEILQALANSDVAGALHALSSSDLYWLVDSLMQSPPNPKSFAILTEAIARESKVVEPDQVNYFGGVHPATDGCAQPHLTRLAPYEEYENFFFTDPLAEHLNDILLYLAEAADRRGVPVQGLAILAEPAVQQFSTKLKMSHTTDWQSAIEALRSIELNALIPLLEKN